MLPICPQCFWEHESPGDGISDSSAQVVWRPGMTLEDVKLAVLGEAFEYYGCNRTEIARRLGISVRTVRSWLKQARQRRAVSPYG